MLSSNALQAKYRSGGLTPEDRSPLLECILNETNPLELAGLLYIWGRSFDEAAEVKALCIRHINEPSPHLTSVCMKLVCDWWGHWREYQQELGRYLDPELFQSDEWYDEVIVAFSFVSRNPYGWSPETLARYRELEREAERIGLGRFD